LRRIVSKNHRTTAAQITAELNIHLDNPVSTKAVPLIFMLFLTSGRVYVWRTPKEAYNPEYQVSTLKHRGRSVMFWATVVQYSFGPIIILHGRNTARGYVDRLGSQVHPMIQTIFPKDDAVFQDDTQLELFSHGLKCMKVKFNISVQCSHHI
jgi:hypothetical protein